MTSDALLLGSPVRHTRDTILLLLLQIFLGNIFDILSFHNFTATSKFLDKRVPRRTVMEEKSTSGTKRQS
jgi:hypothetical protein